MEHPDFRDKKKRLLKIIYFISLAVLGLTVVREILAVSRVCLHHAHGLSICVDRRHSTWAQVVAAHQLSCSKSRGSNLETQDRIQVPALQGGFLTTGPLREVPKAREV